MAAQAWAASVTFSKTTESHAGTVIHGQRAREGYTHHDLLKACNHALASGHEASLINLDTVCGTPERAASVLVIRGATSLLADLNLVDLHNEYLTQIWPQLDRRLVQYGKVMNKHARGNAELGPYDIPSTYNDFATGEKVAGRPISGRVVAFDQVPLHGQLVRGWENLLGEKGKGLLAEVNHYGPSCPRDGVKDGNKSHSFAATGIGFHGDSERPDVACLCLGNTAKELHFQAYAGMQPIGERCIVTLHPGDAYIMCEAACGFRWKTELRTPAVVHYRHAAGAPNSTKWTPTIQQIQSAADKKAAGKRKRQYGEDDAAATGDITTAASAALSQSLENSKRRHRKGCVHV